MIPTTHIGDISHVIQLAVAPVFLLAGVGTVLAVLSGRLSRAVDRARVLEDQIPGLAGEALGLVREELLLLSRRMQLIYAAIALDVACALLICLVIAVAFVDAFLVENLAPLMGGLFLLAMLSLIGCLATFLREIFISVRSAREVMRRRVGAARG